MTLRPTRRLSHLPLKGWMLDHEKVPVVSCKNIWCKFEMDVIEFYEGTQMKTRSLIKGAFIHNIRLIWCW